MTDTPATVVVALENLRELGIDEDEIYLLKQRVVAVFDAMLAARPALSAAPVGEGGVVDTLKARIVELEAQVFVPGLHRCAKCGCKTVCNTLNAVTGTIRADSKPQDCPNGCGPMWPVTEREAGNDMADRLEALTPREEAPAEAGEDAAWVWLNGHVECDPADRDYSADEMVDAYMAGQAALRARSSEPVAWRYRCLDPQGLWLLTDHAPTNAAIVDRPNVWEVQPLYTHPAADPDKLRVAREALEKVRNVTHRSTGFSDLCARRDAFKVADEALAALNAEGL